MTATSEQLAKRREDAKAAAIAWWNADHTLVFTHSVPNGYEAGYLRRCQETEQALKDARKQVIQDCANFANGWAIEHVIEDDANLIVGDYIIKSMGFLKCLKKPENNNAA